MKIVKLLLITLFYGAQFILSQKAVIDQEGIYIVCEKMPEIKGGLKALSKVLKYPKEAKKLGVQGVVYVQFIVDERGKVKKPFSSSFHTCRLYLSVTRVSSHGGLVSPPKNSLPWSIRSVFRSKIKPHDRCAAPFTHHRLSS